MNIMNTHLTIFVLMVSAAASCYRWLSEMRGGSEVVTKVFTSQKL